MRQCPRCELRFANADELDDHLAVDHGIARDRLPDRRGVGVERPMDDGG